MHVPVVPFIIVTLQKSQLSLVHSIRQKPIGLRTPPAKVWRHVYRILSRLMITVDCSVCSVYAYSVFIYGEQKTEHVTFRCCH